ncbi:MAG: carbamoyl phosphate synthase small subunit [Deltaproteobacteria bacterium]|nr:MAG: carbamoyl phosphate synthase small subunit [Deltaproteobacteria bacterium]
MGEKVDAAVALEDGSVFYGASFGAPGTVSGEIVFNTSMMGYQEILTDPSYKGQIVTMTYPLIGNYGVNPEDMESEKPHVEGFIVREASRLASNWRSREDLGAFMKRHHIVGIEGVDTRAITKLLRVKGALNGVISTEEMDRGRLVEMARACPGLIGRDLVREVTCQTPYEWTETSPWVEETLAHMKIETQPDFHVVAIDCGVKWNILRILKTLGARVTVVPAQTDAEAILAMEPDGVFISNGPGDPQGVPYVAETVRNLLGKKPVFGICLGHQILGLALGGTTYKLKFGHHGGNQPVMDLARKTVAITAQNHGFCVDEKSLPADEVVLTHINLNDQTPEGMRHKTLPVFSVQYHPENSPGPHDAISHFLEFFERMKKAEG